jgi:hypothetical protein
VEYSIQISCRKYKQQPNNINIAKDQSVTCRRLTGNDSVHNISKDEETEETDHHKRVRALIDEPTETEDDRDFTIE